MATMSFTNSWRTPDFSVHSFFPLTLLPYVFLWYIALLQPLKDAIIEKLMPFLTGRNQCSAEERKLLSLPTRYGALNIINPVPEASSQFIASKKISEPLKEMVVMIHDT